MKLIVLELFAGAAGASHALRQLGIPDEDCLTILVESGDAHPNSWVHRTLEKNFPHCTIVKDVKEVDRAFIEDLHRQHPSAVIFIPGGFPCQDLSRANRHGVGLAGARSSLAYHFVSIIAWAQDAFGMASTLWLAENVVPKRPEWQTALDELFRCRGVLRNSAATSTCSRRRIFWANFTLGPQKDVKAAKATSLDPGWVPLEDALIRKRVPLPQPSNKWATFCKPFGPGRPEEWPSSYWHYPLGSYSFDNLVVPADISDHDLATVIDKVKQGQALRSRGEDFDPAARGPLVEWIHKDNHLHLLRPLHGEERRRSLGYPPGSMFPGPTAPEPFSRDDYIVGAIAGNAFPEHVVLQLLAPLAESILHNKPLTGKLIHLIDHTGLSHQDTAPALMEQ